MLCLQNLTYFIHKRKLFNEINITFLPSSITYINGSNGSGKTSLIRMIAGIQSPTSGKIYLGMKPKYTNLNSPWIYSDNYTTPYCTYIGHNLGLKLDYTVYDNLKFWSKIYNSETAFEASLHYFNLFDILYNKCYTLSAGMKKKVALSKLLSCQSNLWLLDEVESNLDEENQKLLYNLIITKANNGGIILLTSHSNIAIQSAQIFNLS